MRTTAHRLPATVRGSFAALLLPLLLAGCFSGRGDALCREAADCAAGELCARTGECVDEAEALRVVLTWTVGGQRPGPEDPAPCAAIGELEVLFHDRSGGPEESFRPVPCTLGRVVYDVMPGRLDRVEIVAYSPEGRVLDRVGAPLEPGGETVLELDLSP